MAELTTADLGLRERKKIKTRRHIRTVALDLALEGGVENATVDAIVHRAGVSRRTFFNYFDHKDDALVTDTATVSDALRREIIARPAEESPLHAIRAVVTERDIFALMNTNRERTLARQKLVKQHPFLAARQLTQHAHMEQALAEAVATRLGADAESDLRPSLIASVAGSAMRVAAQWWSTREHENLVRALTTAFDMLEQGLLTDAATGPDGTEPTPMERGPSTHE